MGPFSTPAHKQANPAAQPGQVVNPIPAQTFAPTPDFTVVNGGSIVMVYANTQAALDWVEEHLDLDVWQCVRAVAIEPRFIGSVLDGIAGAGLTVK